MLVVISNVVWIAVISWTWYKTRDLLESCGSNNYPADFVSKEPVPLKLKTTNFDDLLRYNTTSHQVYREMDPSLPEYFGTPSPAIDAAWEKLLRYQYPAVSDEEIASNPALSFASTDKHPVTGKYYGALDVFHNLHCLNMVRRHIDRDYYGGGHMMMKKKKKRHGKRMNMESSFDAAAMDHLYHCMNHIRQSLQCRPDLSPAAMHVFLDTDGSQFFLGNAKSHSCYDWQSIMDWAEARESTLGYTQPIN
ncbi:hypothetical protein FLAG1_00169 [Fusarium langsethiae]|uniref:Tat pathway signal sequence n=1 Tax=Fusarium langsethiae TaxID=179993 RepID=A0A0N0DII2_FUSLA|nr:hypothetical protein FLAG1_00169 [Fusarium langsethiae]GKT97831.1 unnamed protein product [Fusarium langsethiae]GKU10773.1 unnamed protein product [Fusarium langsethiae]